MTKKQKRVDSFFTRTYSTRIDEDTTTEEETKEPVRDENPPSISVVKKATFLSIQRDPGVHKPIWNYPPSINKGQDTFAINGFKNWNRVKGKHWHIDQVMQRLSDEEVRLNRLRVKATINLVRVCSFQGISSRGRDERVGSKNRGNFLEILNLLGSYNEEIASIVLENAPDEASDESKKEQMAIVLRFVDNKGFIQERFFGVIHLADTSSATLYSSICATLSSYLLPIENIRGQ
ncbi:zinc finger MYM-type protein 1-like protein [Tanacetum coccineum]